MKSLLVMGVLLSLVFTSCSKKNDADFTIPVVESSQMIDESKPSEPAKPVKIPNPVEEGLALVEGSDCLSCHKKESRLIGPSYQEVADKYTEADMNYLAQKIIDGGQGVWGDIPMPAHQGMSQENALKMAKYIFSLKK